MCYEVTLLPIKNKNNKIQLRNLHGSPILACVAPLSLYACAWK